jgi:hypothetical protein
MYTVLYGSGTWSLTLEEEFRPRALENKVLGRIFSSERQEVRFKKVRCILTHLTYLKLVFTVRKIRKDEIFILFISYY